MTQWLPGVDVRTLGASLWRVSALTVLLLLSTSASAQNPPRPNMIVIMVDDMGFSDIGSYGGEIATPNLDSLARQGLRFTQFYNNGKCEPTRASLLTGHYPQEVGASATVTYRAPTFGEVLREAGYRTLMAGKWHAGQKPFDRGFDRHFGLTDGCCNYFNPGEPIPGEPVPSHKRFPRRWAIDDQQFQPYTPDDPDFYTTDAFTDDALEYLREYQHEDRPFLLYLAYTAPHYPLHARQEDIARYRGRYREGWDQLRARRAARQVDLGVFPSTLQPAPRDPDVPDWQQLSPEEQDQWDHRMAVYAAMIDRVDQNVGRLLETLRQIGRADNTLILFFSDNGGEAAMNDWSRVPGTPPGTVDSYRTVGRPWANASNTPLRKFKTQMFEGGIASPMIAWWPDVIPAGGWSHQVAHLIDVLPTMIELAGAAQPTEHDGATLDALPGMSLVSTLRDPDQPPAERTLYWKWNRSGAVRQGDWKLVRGPRAESPWELYDLGHDRTELQDRSVDQPGRLAELVSDYQQWIGDAENSAP